MTRNWENLFLEENRIQATYHRPAGKAGGRRQNERGIALVFTLLLLSLMMAVGLAMVLTINSDMLINGYYRNYRGAFYAADSGMNIAREQMVNQIVIAVPPTFTRPPLTTSNAAAVQSYISTNYGTYTSVQSGSSWAESFQIPAGSVTFTQSSCTVTASISNPVGTCAADMGATSYQYIYSYSITSTGRSAGSQLTNVKETGNITINVVGSGVSQSFAAYGMFIDQQTVCSGSYLVPGIISGPVFTNGGWTFGRTGTYTFTDPIGSASPTAGFQFTSCYASTAGNYSSGSQSINPIYQSGHQWGAPTVPLPTNDFSQRRAVLDGLGTNTANPTAAELNAALRNISGTPYPAGAPPASGVYLPYQTAAGPPITRTMTGGGILVRGNAAVVLTASTSGGNPTQVYTITQGGTTTTVTTNVAANTTTIVSGATTVTISGVPMNHVGTSSPATMLYVDGNITSLRGPAQGVPAIQDGSALTITALNSVTITGDILYRTEPVTLTQNQIPGTPADTLIPGNNNGQTLGIFTATGNINLANAQANGNLQIDATMATISQGGTGGIVNTGSAINTFKHSWRAHPEQDYEYQCFDAERLLRPSLCAGQRIFAAVVSIHDAHQRPGLERHGSFRTASELDYDSAVAILCLRLSRHESGSLSLERFSTYCISHQSRDRQGAGPTRLRSWLGIGFTGEELRSTPTGEML